MAKSGSKEITAPIIVLVCICLVASFLLAGVYQITAPVIAEREKAEADAARIAVLPEGSSFTLKEIAAPLAGITEVYTADNGAGYTVSTNVKGMNSGLKLMVGINSNGEISGINVLGHDETAGIGTKVLDQANLDKWIGTKAASAVDSISGATYTSNGVKTAIQAALDQVAAIK